MTLQCEQCPFVAKTPRGLAIHRSTHRKQAVSKGIIQFTNGVVRKFPVVDGAIAIQELNCLAPGSFENETA